jgi:hypothetical protein
LQLSFGRSFCSRLINLVEGVSGSKESAHSMPHKTANMTPNDHNADANGWPGLFQVIGEGPKASPCISVRSQTCDVLLRRAWFQMLVSRFPTTPQQRERPCTPHQPRQQFLAQVNIVIVVAQVYPSSRRTCPLLWSPMWRRSQAFLGRQP